MNHVLYVVVLTRGPQNAPLICWSQPLQTSKVGLNIASTFYLLLQIVVWADCLSYLASAAEKTHETWENRPAQTVRSVFYKKIGSPPFVPLGRIFVIDSCSTTRTIK
jgi:hypothetical protein